MIKGIVPQLAEGGKIKIGGLGEARQSKSGGTYRMPVKLDHFLLTKTTRDANGDLAQDAELMQVLADAGYADEDGCIRELPIVLHSDEIDEVFPTSYANYQGKKLYCRGDGETATRWKFDGKVRTNETKQLACTCPFLAERKCKPHGTLHCSIRIEGHAVAGSVYKWRTTSIISIQQMIGSLLQIQQMVGALRNVPLVLKLREVEVSPDGQTSRVFVCHVELRAKDVMSLQQHLLQQARTRREVMGELDSRVKQSYRALIAAPASDDETEEEQAEVAAEFHPTEGNNAVVAPVTKTERTKELLKARRQEQPAPAAVTTTEPVTVVYSEEREPGQEG